MTDGKTIFPVHQGGNMGQVLTNVRTFPKQAEQSKLESFWLKYGAKEMVTPKKESDGAIATKWNSSVLGLTATLLVLVSALITVVVNYTSLSADFRSYQKTTDEKIQKFEQKLDKIEDWQRQDSLQKAKVQGYQLGAAETKQKEEK